MEIDSRKEILQAIQSIKGKKPKRVFKQEVAKPEIMPPAQSSSSTNSLVEQYFHFLMHEKKHSSRTKISIHKNHIEVDNEERDIERHREIIEKTIADKTITDNLHKKNSAHESNSTRAEEFISRSYSGCEPASPQAPMLPAYQRIATYEIEEHNSKTTYYLFRQTPVAPGEYNIPQLDVKQQVAPKMMEKLPLPSGLYGFTYLGTNYMAINESLDTRPQFKEEVMIHEAIHTPDEYETRVITWWMMSTDQQYVVGVQQERYIQ